MWAWASAAIIAASCVSAPPRDLTLDEKRHFYLKAEAPVIVADALMEEEAFARPLREALGREPLMTPASLSDRLPEGIFVGTAAHPGALEKRKFRRYLDGASVLGDEGYRIVVGKDGIVVLGGGVRGAWYGLHRLADLVETHQSNLPHLDLRDWPELGLRGARLETMPDETDLYALAAVGCTHVFFESEDFHDLTGVRATAWRNVFKTARSFHLVPVPIFSTLMGMERILRERPLLIEGRAVAERIALHGLEPRPLRYPNIIAEHPETLGVSISGVACIYGKDYTLEPQPLVAPFSPQRAPWRIQRLPGGAIPDGAQVEVRYSFATEDSSSLCFAAPESRAWLRTALERLVTELEPEIIHLDHGAIGRMNQDSRSLGRNLTNADTFVQSLALMSSMVKEVGPDIRLMMWSDLLNPAQGAGAYGLEGAQPPEEIVRLARIQARSPREAAERFDQVLPVASVPPVMALDGTAAAASVLQQAMTGKGLRGGGLIALADTPDDAAPTLEVAWTGSAGGSIWTRLLNSHFDANLVRPDYAAARAVLARYLNGETLRGNSPGDAFQRFEAACASHPDYVASDVAGHAMARELMGQLTEYLILEERFAQLGGEDSLAALGALAARVRAGDPAADPARYERLASRIADGHFVSAAELFEEDLRAYRPDRPVLPQFEIPVEEAIEVSAAEVRATIFMPPGQASVRRLEIEGSGLTSAALSGAHAGGEMREIMQWSGAGLAGVRGALLLVSPADYPTLTFSAALKPGGEFTGLRLFGDKPEAIMECGYAAIPPVMDATFNTRPWAEDPQAGALLRRDEKKFGEAPTSVRVTRTRDAVYIGIEAGEPRPDAMIADFTLRDAPLWEQESVEIWIQPEGRLPLRLIASPLGTQYDSEANDAGWDGDWEAVVKTTERGWNLLVRIPAAMIGDPQRGSALPFNLVRNRRGGGDEESAWAQAYGAQPDLQWGVLKFP